MIEFGPRQMPDARIQMMLDWGHNEGLTPADWLQLPAGYKAPMVTAIQHAISEADLYWVHREMVELIQQTTPSVPDDVALLPELMSADYGVVAFETPLTMFSFTDSDWIDVDAISWGPAVRSDAETNNLIRAELWIQVYQRSDHAWTLHGGSVWIMGEAVGRCHDYIGPGRYLLALWALIRSPGVADEIERPQERHARKRSARAGASTDAVRVIRLRRHESHGHTDGTSHYHHRWIVSGHWRSQPYGPGRSQRKPVWIMPHVKGPEGAPMLTGEKVRVL